MTPVRVEAPARLHMGMLDAAGGDPAAVFSAWYLKERLSRRHMAALALGMAGIALLIGPELFGLHSNPLGPLLMIGAAICWAGGIVAMKGQSWPIGSGAWRRSRGCCCGGRIAWKPAAIREPDREGGAGQEPAGAPNTSIAARIDSDVPTR